MFHPMFYPMFHPNISNEHKPSGEFSASSEHEPGTYKKKQNLIVLHKNARGLSRDDRITELSTELENMEWDFVSINETMRTTESEIWATQGGHMFMGAGHDLPTRGVGFLVHKKWSSALQQFKRVNERLAYIDIRSKKMRMRFVTAYFPHSGYADEDVQKLYDELGEIQRESKSRKMCFMIGADCNAQTGVADDADTNATIGRFGLAEKNSRGRWLTSWATIQNLVIANTHFEKPTTT